MSALPKAVQAQLDQAEAIQAQLTAVPAPVAGNTETVVEVPSQATQVEPTEVQESQVAPVVQDDTWEKRFQVLQGKYNAELPRLHQQNKELSERLEQAIKAMETKREEPVVENRNQVTDADVESFGSEMIDMVRRAARDEFEVLSRKFADELDKRFGQVVEKVASTEERIVKSDTEKFWDDVLKKVPDFDAINADPKWFEFLDSRINGTRFTRRAVAESAISSLDAQSLIEQLTEFKDANALANKVVEEPVTKTKKNLNAQVPPNSSKAAPVPDAQTGRIYTGAEYAAALDHRNLQRMSREDYERQVAEAEQALAEGRVRF